MCHSMSPDDDKRRRGMSPEQDTVSCHGVSPEDDAVESRQQDCQQGEEAHTEAAQETCAKVAAGAHGPYLTLDHAHAHSRQQHHSADHLHLTTDHLNLLQDRLMSKCDFTKFEYATLMGGKWVETHTRDTHETHTASGSAFGATLASRKTAGR